MVNENVKVPNSNTYENCEKCVPVSKKGALVSVSELNGPQDYAASIQCNITYSNHI
jgi:hypothetical protein